MLSSASSGCSRLLSVKCAELQHTSHKEVGSDVDVQYEGGVSVRINDDVGRVAASTGRNI